MSRTLTIFAAILVPFSVCLAKPGETVGPVKPVEVVNAVITVEGTVQAELDEPVDVEIVNADPVPVVLGEPVRYQQSVDVLVPPGEGFACSEISFPAGTRFLLNQISGDVRLPTDGDQRAIVFVTTAPDANPASIAVRHVFPLTATESNISVGPQAQNFVFNEQPNIFHDAYSVPFQVCISRGPTPGGLTGNAFGRLVVSGELTQIP